MLKNEITKTEEDIDVEIHYDHLYKIVIIGDSGVGKTSLISKYVKGIFPPSPLPTIAIEFATKIIQIKEGGYIKAQIWDTAGQERYKSITSHHYKKAIGGLIVYDITRRTTYDHVYQWLCDLKDNAEKGVISTLIGNKKDLLERNNRKREVTYNEASDLAKKYNMLFYETSAYGGENVIDAFEDLLQRIYTERRKISNIQKNYGISLKTNIEKNDEKDSFCCGS